MSMPAETLRGELNLRQLLAGIADAPAVTIRGLRSDSRALQAGEVFVAYAGIGSHGLD